MKMTHETAVLKGENEGDLLPLFRELTNRVVRAAQEGLPVHEVEKAVWQQVLQIGRQALRQFFTLLGTGDLGETIPLPDGRSCQRLEQLHGRRYVSIFGEFQLQRTVYGSREGQKLEFIPLDNRLQLPSGAFSYLLQDWDQSFCIEQAFGPSAQAIARILGLRQAVDSLERMNEDMAGDILDFWEERPLPPAAEEGALLVSSADGKGIVMRREEPTPVPVHRTKGAKASTKRMATVGTVYTVERYLRTPEQVVAALFREGPRPPEDRPQPQHKLLWASLSCDDDEEPVSSVDIVYSWLADQVDQRNPEGRKELVFLSDGQPCLWEARREYLPEENATDILDLLHAASYVWQAAHAFYKEGSADAENFVRERLLRILQGQSDRVVRGLREMGTKRGLAGSKKKTLAKVCAYFDANRERMHYDEYLRKGYPIASGVIEGACRHLVKDRMERAGMHWTPDGAQAMLQVRSIYVNGDWESYQSFRIEQERKRLYPFQEIVKEDRYPVAA
jgi:hypothetical protein